MTLRQMNRTNEQDTCLWCGQQLQRKYFTDLESYKLDPQEARSRCCKAKLYQIKINDSSVNLWRCSDCDDSESLTRTRAIKRKPIHKHTGPYGDGFFCTLKCGHRFAVAAANNGYRFKPYKESAEMEKQ